MIQPDALALDTGTSLEQAKARASRYELTFLAMKPWLPPADSVENFLDIGCGLGGVAIWCARHFPRATAHLLDGDEYTEKWTSYREDGQPWADVKLAAQLFAKHCPGRRCVQWTPSLLKQQEWFGACAFELVYSNVSWGHHYPIQTYLDLIRRTLKRGGTLIVDLRVGEIGEAGFAKLAEFFNPQDSMHVEGKKYRRTRWSAP